MTERDFDVTVFKSFLEELPWETLKAFVNSQPQMQKKIAVGGFKLQKKNINRTRHIIRKHCVKDDYVNLFLDWYSAQKKYTDFLDPYFESEEYENWAQERGVDQNRYALPDKMFDKFIAFLEPCHAPWFLYLSPMVFGEEQEQRILAITEGKNITDSEEQDENQTNHEVSQLNTKNLEKQLKDYWRQVKKLNKERDLLKSEVEKLKHKNTRLKERASEGFKQDNEAEIRLNSELFECRETLAEQEILTKKKDLELNTLAKKSMEKDRQIDNLKKKLGRLQDNSQKHFTRILECLDSEKFLSSLNASDEVREVLETVVRPPSDDGNEAQFSNVENFGKFWKELIDREWSIAQGIFALDVESVASREYFQEWADRKDEFNDLKYLLSTRLFLSKILHEILLQYYSESSST